MRNAIFFGVSLLLPVLTKIHHHTLASWLGTSITVKPLDKTFLSNFI